MKTCLLITSVIIMTEMTSEQYYYYTNCTRFDRHKLQCTYMIYPQNDVYCFLCTIKSHINVDFNIIEGSSDSHQATFLLFHDKFNYIILGLSIYKNI